MKTYPGTYGPTVGEGLAKLTALADKLEAENAVIRAAMPPKRVEATLPFPPSVNNLFVSVRRGNKMRRVLGKRGRNYRELVAACVAGKAMLFGPLELNVTYVQPDKRMRDLDNLLKALLDAMKHAGLYRDDSQIQRINASFDGYAKGGLARVVLTEITNTFSK